MKSRVNFIRLSHWVNYAREIWTIAREFPTKNSLLHQARDEAKDFHSPVWPDEYTHLSIIHLL